MTEFPAGARGGARPGPKAGFETSAQCRAQQATTVMGPVAILWDIENCPVPNDVLPEAVAGNILMALRLHPAVLGAVTMFSAYGDFNYCPRKLREGFQRTGVNLIDVPNGRKDAADKAILVDMFLFVLDNSPPATILLVSGDVDFAAALHKLGQRGYTVVLAIPSGAVSSALANAGRFVWDWPSLARGEGLVAAKLFGCHMISPADTKVGDFSEEQQRYSSVNARLAATSSGQAEELFIGEGTSCASDRSRSDQTQAELLPVGWNLPSLAPGRGVSGVSTFSRRQTDCRDQSNVVASEENSWMQPGDLEGLKRQLVKLLILHGGKLSLLRVPAEYAKLFGRPLYLAEYGVFKLVQLLVKLRDVVQIKGEGNHRTIYITSVGAQLGRKYRGGMALEGVKMNLEEDTESRYHQASVEDDSRELVDVNAIGKNVSDERVPQTVLAEEYVEDMKASVQNLALDEGSSSVFYVQRMEQEAVEVKVTAVEHVVETRLALFRLELQELLVSHACKILMSNFQALYQQRYAKRLDLVALGVQKLETLFDKVKDVAMLEEHEMASGRTEKVLVANLNAARV